MSYAITVRPLSEDDGGGYLAEAIDLPGCMGDGESPQDALENCSDAIAEWIDEAERQGRSVPDPDAHSGKWVQRVPKTLHARLAERAKKEGVSLNQFVTAVLAEGLGRRAN